MNNCVLIIETVFNNFESYMTKGRGRLEYRTQMANRPSQTTIGGES
jgi:hypothetical protein